MPTPISHAAVAVAAAIAFAPEDVSNHFWLLSIICSIISDIDVIGFSFGIPYGHLLGHRGFFHSPFFALLISIFLTFVFFHDLGIFSRQWFFYFIFFFLLSVSHGILDAFTNGGLGIALLSPFDNKRYFFPWTPIVVSPIGIKAFFSKWGLMVIKSELLWIWLPSCLVVVISTIFRTIAERH
ncbi:MAG: metal-dependent hydrolase [Nitrospirota bacterium]